MWCNVQKVVKERGECGCSVLEYKIQLANDKRKDWQKSVLVIAGDQGDRVRLVIVAVAIAVEASDAVGSVDDASVAVHGALHRLEVQLLRNLPGKLLAPKVAVAGGVLVDGAVQGQITRGKNKL